MTLESANTRSPSSPQLPTLLSSQVTQKSSTTSLLSSFPPAAQNIVSHSLPRSHTVQSSFAAPIDAKSSLFHSHPPPKCKPPSTGRSSLRGLLKFLFGYLQEPDAADMAIEDAWSVATKRRGVYNLIQVPMRLERLLILGQFICLHELLGLFTMLPVRVALGVVRVPWSLVTSRKRGWARTAIDALHLSLLMITAVMLRLFDISWIYHNIRGQSVIKLYVVFNVIEIFDRLCSSFGVDILDSLGWTTHSAILFFSRPRQGGRSALAKATALQGLALVSRVVFDYLFALFYVLLHATLLLTWVVTLNVAINTQNNALLTLLVSNNFVELKGAVFKPFKVQNLFQIACSDGVERFQMTVFLGIMLMVTRGDERLFSVWGIIYGCEVIVDWVKHAFVTKFNRIPHRVYHQFSLVICDDMARVKSHSMVRSIGGSGVSKRIGFVSLPLAALVARMAWSSIIRLPRFAAAVLWISLMGFKMALGMCLVGHAWRKTKGMNAGVEVAEDGDGFWVQKLLQVERYELIAKN